MEALREGIGLRGYGQKDPKQEYKKEGFVIFGEMMGSIGRNVCEKLFHMQVQRDEAAAPRASAARRTRRQPQRRGARTIESGGGAEPRAAAATASGAPDEAQAGAPRRAQGRAQRSLSLRQR